MQPINPEKIEAWKKKGNGPWIVLRLEPAKSKEDADLRLAEIVFRPNSGGQIITSLIPIESWERYNGYRAITIFFLLGAAVRTKSMNPGEEIQLSETSLRPSWLTTFGEFTQLKKFEKSNWLRSAFGVTSPKEPQGLLSTKVRFDNGLARLAKVSGRTGDAAKNVEDAQRILADPDAPSLRLFLKSRSLDPRNISIIKGFYADPLDIGLTSTDELSHLAIALESVEKKWWKTLSREAPQIVPAKTFANASESQPTSDVDVVAEGNLALPQSFKTMTEVFRDLSAASIKTHIVAALHPGRGDEAVGNSLAEILSPECISQIAEKLVQGPLDAFVDFYSGDYDSPPNIKKSLAVVIATNKGFRAQLAEKVVRSGYRDMIGWFQVFGFFCPHEIALQVENALLRVSNEPEFKERFEIYSAAHLTKLIDHFSDLGCDSAARVFEKISQQQGGR